MRLKSTLKSRRTTSRGARSIGRTNEDSIAESLPSGAGGYQGRDIGGLGETAGVRGGRRRRHQGERLCRPRKRTRGNGQRTQEYEGGYWEREETIRQQSKKVMKGRAIAWADLEEVCLRTTLLSSSLATKFMELLFDEKAATEYIK